MRDELSGNLTESSRILIEALGHDNGGEDIRKALLTYALVLGIFREGSKLRDCRIEGCGGRFGVQNQNATFRGQGNHIRDFLTALCRAKSSNPSTKAELQPIRYKGFE